jgi:hypothetical protein
LIKIPAPTIPPITIMVASKKPIRRTSLGVVTCLGCRIEEDNTMPDKVGTYG